MTPVCARCLGAGTHLGSGHDVPESDLGAAWGSPRVFAAEELVPECEALTVRERLRRGARAVEIAEEMSYQVPFDGTVVA